MRRLTTRRKAFLFSTIGAAAMILAALPATPAAAETAALEEVIVTAERRETTLQETPIAVTAFTADDLRGLSASNVIDIGRLTPNMFFRGGANSAGTANNAQIYLRGVGQTDFLPTSDPGVGLYLDEVYIGRSVGGILTLADVDRIEVLRGPQGTLFGRNTIGGAINVVTRKPALGELHAWGELTVGEDDWQQLDGAINVPLAPTLAARASWQYKTRNGYGKSTSVDTVFGNDENATLRGQIKWRATDALELLLSADYYHQNQSSTPSIVYGSALLPQSVVGLYNGLMVPLAGVPPVTPADFVDLDDPYIGRKTSPSVDDSEIFGVSMIAHWTLSERLTVKSITSYREMDAHYADDTSGYAQNIGTVDERFDQHQFSQELQLFGHTERLDWLLGLYYFREHGVSLNRVPLIPGLFTVLESLPGPIIPLAPGVPCPPPPGVPAPCAGGAGNPVNIGLDIGQVPLNDLTVDSYAVFGQASWHFTDRLAATFGFRVSYENKDFFTANWRPEASAVLGVTQFLVPPTRRDEGFDDFSPKVGVEYRWSDDLLLYASYTEGFRSGTFNGRAGAQRAVESVAPETVRSYELGFKSEWLDRRLRLNGAGYYVEYSDIQFISVEPDPLAGFIVFLRNADEAQVAGFELEGLAGVTPNFTVYANLGLTDSEVTEISPALSATTGVTDGAALRKAPEWTYAVGGQYTLHTGYGRFTGRADWNWVDDVFHEASNDPRAREDSYGLLSLRLAWTDPSETWELAAFAKNVTDEVYFNSLFVQGGTELIAYPARGRELGLSLRWNGDW